MQEAQLQDAQIETKGWLEPAALLKEWLEKAKNAAHGHRMAAKHYSSCHSRVGLSTLILSLCLVGTLAIKIQNISHGDWVLAGLGAIVVALTALQTFKKYDSLSYVHDSLRARYSATCREIEATLAISPRDRGNPKEVLDRIRQRLDELALANMPIPEPIWKSSVASKPGP